jgi:hypothetical protein
MASIKPNSGASINPGSDAAINLASAPNHLSDFAEPIRTSFVGVRVIHGARLGDKEGGNHTGGERELGRMLLARRICKTQ